MNPTEISKLRQSARQLKRAMGITHTEALDQVSRTAGHRDWAALMAAAPALEPATRRSLITLFPTPKAWARYVFHAVRVEGMLFRATMYDCDGPFLEASHGARWHDHGGQVSLGVCQLTHFDTTHQWRLHREERGWWICKYSGEARIDVNRLSDAGRRALTHEFGLPEWPAETSSLGDNFYASPAFVSLVAWSRAHPQVARRAAAGRSTYVGDWYSRTQAQHER